jgi:hypothetical protein
MSCCSDRPGSTHGGEAGQVWVTLSIYGHPIAVVPEEREEQAGRDQGERPEAEGREGGGAE